ncbi:MAG: hypothetical protein JW867_05390 [Candidatus Omnitrophica bacterium]|nr:hypothetical protein [Candidatus Omnitrophota bacterium]
MKILITAGATWIKIDDVRILTNRFTGKTGLFLCENFRKKGHSVTLLINPHCLPGLKQKGVITYRYFNEFKEQITQLLKKNKYDAIIHMAAVSDYELKKPAKGKIPSLKNSLYLRLRPTEKIIKKIRSLAENSLLIQFKLEPRRRGLINDAYSSLLANKSNFVVANALEDLKDKYKGFLVDRDRNVVPVHSQGSLARLLEQIIRESRF